LVSVSLEALDVYEEAQAALEEDAERPPAPGATCHSPVRRSEGRGS